jgi:retron-type reverse transcriptase
VVKEGNWRAVVEGTPQGGVISPLLANLFLHYAFDRWLVQWHPTWAKGDVIVVRYADDFVVGFQYEDEAKCFLSALKGRMIEAQKPLKSTIV